MTAANHTLTGSAWALTTATVLPVWVILPVALLMHYAMDALPHFGQLDNEKAALARLKWFLPIDAALALIVLGSLFLVRPEYWLLAMAAGVLCARPDLLKTRRFIRFLRGGDSSRGRHREARFHRYIQWGERLWGIWIELAWFAAFGFVLATKLWHAG
jgi:hypothetical protein